MGVLFKHDSFLHERQSLKLVKADVSKSPTLVIHWNVVIRILRYLKKASGQGLLYEDKGNTQIFGNYDADWDGSPMDRRSTTGYCVLFGGNIISWKSKKQNIVARSSTKVVYWAMTSLVWVYMGKTVTWRDLEK